MRLRFAPVSFHRPHLRRPPPRFALTCLAHPLPFPSPSLKIRTAAFYLLRRRSDDTVVAACLIIGINPRAPYEIIPANGPLIRRYADKFCRQSEPIDMFVQEADGKWYYRGKFKLAGQSKDANEIKLRAQHANRRNIYKILFLEAVRA